MTYYRSKAINTEYFYKVCKLNILEIIVFSLYVDKISGEKLKQGNFFKLSAQENLTLSNSGSHKLFWLICPG